MAPILDSYLVYFVSSTNTILSIRYFLLIGNGANLISIWAVVFKICLALSRLIPNLSARNSVYISDASLSTYKSVWLIYPPMGNHTFISLQHTSALKLQPSGSTIGLIGLIQSMLVQLMSYNRFHISSNQSFWSMLLTALPLSEPWTQIEFQSPESSSVQGIPLPRSYWPSLVRLVQWKLPLFDLVLTE